VFEGLTINYNSLKSMLKNAYDAFKSEEYYGAGQNIGFVMNLIWREIIWLKYIYEPLSLYLGVLLG